MPANERRILGTTELPFERRGVSCSAGGTGSMGMAEPGVANVTMTFDEMRNRHQAVPAARSTPTAAA
jgi:hypothetical protein